MDLHDGEDHADGEDTEVDQREPADDGRIASFERVEDGAVPDVHGIGRADHGQDDGEEPRRQQPGPTRTGLGPEAAPGVQEAPQQQAAALALAELFDLFRFRDVLVVRQVVGMRVLGRWRLVAPARLVLPHVGCVAHGAALPREAARVAVCAAGRAGPRNAAPCRRFRVFRRLGATYSAGCGAEACSRRRRSASHTVAATTVAISGMAARLSTVHPARC